ncbi:hypothetical protein M3P36_14955 [Altererythrobacter sp. KTW20L]|nr:hypothetical protein [Altererythrobacter sp. KTW20L]MCL6252337.1 hypothetical protein [Altererythrobacter sp. KTW20L]
MGKLGFDAEQKATIDRKAKARDNADRYSFIAAAASHAQLSESDQTTE